MQVVEEELINKQMKTLVEMGNSGVIYLLKNKIEGLFKKFHSHWRILTLVIAGMIETLSSENVRSRPGRQKWLPEVDIFSLSALRLDKFVQQELKQRHSDLLWDESVPSSETSNFRLTQFQNNWHYFIII